MDLSLSDVQKDLVESAIADILQLITLMPSNMLGILLSLIPIDRMFE
jgi:hypothetical protein